MPAQGTVTISATGGTALPAGWSGCSEQLQQLLLTHQLMQLQMQLTKLQMQLTQLQMQLLQQQMQQMQLQQQHRMLLMQLQHSQLRLRSWLQASRLS
jgi:TolA-binding protein